MIGQIISHYRIFEELGRGGMGVVYKAEDMKLHRPVAIKVLPRQAIIAEEDKTRFAREAQAAASLSHPNIAIIHEFDEVDDPVTGGRLSFIAMEYVDGETVKQKIKERPLPISEAVNIAIAVAEGLSKAHEKGIIHRDIKAENVMVSRDGVVKIMDFGLAEIAGRSRVTKEGTTVGTVAYMSPEQALGEKLDQRTDIWSLGVLMYEMMTGRLPFEGDYEQAVVYLILNEEPRPIKKFNPIVPPELEQIVNSALRKKPEARYSSAAEVIKELKKYQDSLRAEEMGAVSLRTFLRRIRKPKIAVPTVCTILAILFVAVWFFDRQAKIRWAREEALPEIERLIGESWRDFTEAYKLAEKAEEYIPDDPKLTELFSKSSLKINIKTGPPGAKIYTKEYKAPDTEWKYLGVSPIEKVRVPIGIFRWKMEKEGYETVLAASTTFDVDIEKRNLLVPYDLVRVLDEKRSVPSGMVRVSGAKTDIGELDDFYIDKYEVTNQQYKKFVDSGGYRDRKYWKHKFIKGGKVLTWEQAVAELVDQTGRPGPATWQAGDYLEGQGEYPVSGISWYEAAAFAEFVGKSLPTGSHWDLARGGSTPLIIYPQLGGYAVFAPFSNFKGKGPIPVGSLQGITAHGAYDMAGNVREWCWNETQKGRLIRGGAWNDNTYMFDNLSQAPPMDRSTTNGFRCALYPHPEKIPHSALETLKLGETRDYYKEKPVPASIFQVYKEQFSYDKTDLNARVESKKESPDGWMQEKITFNAAYGGERIIAYLFLPTNTAPPYQTVIYFPGSASVLKESSKDLENYYEFPIFLSFIVKSGRVVLYPVYKGTFERRTEALTLIHYGDNSHLYTEYLTQLVKDFKRCIDYLETRQDIDSKKLAYYGMSWGGKLGAIIPAVEERLEASVLVAGGFAGPARPEADPMNYVTRVKTPTLMLNGKYDTFSPYETSINPMFDLLGTPDANKELKLYETDHIPPRNEFIKETLAWLDRYLGPVK